MSRKGVSLGRLLQISSFIDIMGPVLKFEWIRSRGYGVMAV